MVGVFKFLFACAAFWLLSPAEGWAHGADDAAGHHMPSASRGYEVPEPGSYRLPPLKPAPDGAVLDDDGNALSLHEAFGNDIVLLSFVYTRCADGGGCPLATATLADIFSASEGDPVLAERLRLVTMSFDPSYDTPAVMAEYGPAAEDGGHFPAWLFLTAPSEQALAPILDGFGQVRQRSPKSDDPFGLFSHLLRVYLIDARKRVRNIYGVGFLDPQLLLADIRTLLLEEKAADGS